MELTLVRSPLARETFRTLLDTHPGSMVKVVVDVVRNVLAAGGDLHADGEQVLLDDGARQEDLWGANVYPTQPHERQIEFTSLINIRPRQGNRSMDIEDASRRTAVASLIRTLLPLS